MGSHHPMVALSDSERRWGPRREKPSRRPRAGPTSSTAERPRPQRPIDLVREVLGVVRASLVHGVGAQVRG
ncbi:hypothetical protein GCM10007967_35370 [Xylanimonas ulmi]